MSTRPKKLEMKLAANSWQVNHWETRQDGTEFVIVQGLKDDAAIKAVWLKGHKTLKLFSCMVSNGSARVEDATLRAAMGWAGH